MTALPRESAQFTLRPWNRWVAFAPAAAAAMLGGLILVDWDLRSDLLAGILPGHRAMQPWSALGLVLSGVAAACITQGRVNRSAVWLRRGTAWVLLAIGLGTLTEYLFHIDLGIDRLLFGSAISTDMTGAPFPGRPVIIAAVEFTLLGVALILDDAPPGWDIGYTAAVTLAALLALVALVGYAYRAEVLYNASFYTAIGVQAAAIFFLLCIGLLAMRPERGWVRRLMSHGLGGELARRLLPLMFVAPLLLGWVLLQIDRRLGLDPDLPLAVFAVVAVPVLFALVLWSAAVLDRMESALLEGERRLSLALDAAGAAIWEWDLTSRRVKWSQAFYRLYGLDPAQTATLETWQRSIHPADLKRVMAAVQRAIADGRPYEAEFRAQRPDGSIRWLSEIGHLLGTADGQSQRLIGLTRDITERMAMTSALAEAKAEAERANLAKSRFLAAASHDLRQPVQSLFLFTATLLQRVLDQTTRRLVVTIQQALDTLKLLLDGLLDVSKLDAGLVVPEPAAVPLAPLLERVETEFGERALRTGLRLRTVPCNAVVLTDSVLIERMVRNLVDNALRFTHQGSILIGCRRRGHAVRLDVIDTGPGISPESRQIIFEEFRQLDNPGRDPARGLGLGLAIVRRLGSLLGHDVSLDSQPGKGSRFSIEMPLADAVEPGKWMLVEPGEPEDAQGFLIVIDDEGLVRVGFKTMLEGWGYEVEVAASGEEALQIMTTHPRPPHLILADYRLADGRTGTEAIEAVQNYWGLQIAAIIVTGDTSPERMREAEAYGFPVLHKPVAPAELRRLISHMIRAAAADPVVRMNLRPGVP